MTIQKNMYLWLLSLLLTFEANAQHLLEKQALQKAQKYLYLDQALEQSDSVLVLSLWMLDLKELSPEIAQLTHLQWLELNHNQLKNLPDELAQLEYLQILKVEHNQFQQFPEVIFQLKNLKELNFHQNQLASLPENIDQLQKLEYLDIHDNQIQKLPTTLQNLPHLKFLNLAANPIDEAEKKRIQKLLPQVEIYWGKEK